MFDDQQISGGATPPPNLPTEPEDMFAGIEDSPTSATPTTPKALGAGMLKAKAQSIASVMPNVEQVGVMAENYNTKSPVIGKVVVGVVGLVVFCGMAFGGWWLYNKFFPALSTAPTNEISTVQNTAPVEPAASTNVSTPEPIVSETVATNDTPVVEATNTSSTVAQMRNDQLLFGELKDTDNDGLDDSAEQNLGTSPKLPDTDIDKLCDGDEVLVWKTDPLKADTDGDGYVDGTEVYNGYNPLGPGKLGPLPSGFSTSTVCQSSKK